MKKLYTAFEMELLLFGEQDMITTSPGSYDSAQDDDLVDDDMFD